MTRTLLLLSAAAIALSPASLAQERGRERGQTPRIHLAQADGWGTQFSPGEAREAVREGRTIPLNQIFKQLKREFGGYQLGAELYARDGGDIAVYEIDWMTEDGRKMRFTVDAQTGEVLDQRGG